MWVIIQLERPLMHCTNIAFVCHDDLSKYMKVEGGTSEGVFDYLFDIRVGKFLSEKEKKYLHELSCLLFGTFYDV